MPSGRESEEDRDGPRDPVSWSLATALFMCTCQSATSVLHTKADSSGNVGLPACLACNGLNDCNVRLKSTLIRCNYLCQVTPGCGGAAAAGGGGGGGLRRGSIF